jgi:hypothetical protein
MPGKWAAVFEELATGGEDDDADVRVAEHGKLVRLLQQPTATLAEGHLPVHLVLDPLHHHLPTPHLLGEEDS